MTRTVLPLILLTLGPLGASAAGPGPAPRAAPRAARPLSFDVAVTGEGPPMILIPGLGCSGEVWQETADHYRGRYRLHVLTIHGFAGTPPFAGDFLHTVREDLARYIRRERMQRPVIVGHSIGGILAYDLAAAAPELTGPIVAVDGVPFLPALYDPAATPEAARLQAQQLSAALARMTPVERAAADRKNAAMMVAAPARIEQIARWVDASDVATLGRAMADAYGTDLRPRLRAIRSPVLLVGEEAMFGSEPAALKA